MALDGATGEERMSGAQNGPTALKYYRMPIILALDLTVNLR
jgi:hypothetical protein